MDIDLRLKELGLTLPPAPKPAGLYQPCVISGNLAFLSGQISRDAQGKVLEGKVGGGGLSLAQGQEAARLAALGVLSIMKNVVGFTKIVRIVKMTGFVQTAPDFYEVPAVLNGASELFAGVMGDPGAHARSAVGVASLPLNAAVEIELILELKS
jgi:enamine deaminase RidA (YjgF/YER057c/UK114 family)